MPSPKNPEKTIEQAVKEISSIFEGFTRSAVPSELVDEFRLTLREAVVSVILWATEEAKLAANISRLLGEGKEEV